MVESVRIYFGSNNMKFRKTKIESVYIIEQELREDSRGFFTRVFCKHELADQHIPFEIVQINKSKSVQKGTIRGMHYQNDPSSEDKIVQCIQGSVFDVALDIRPSSLTYGQWVSQELTDENHKMLLIPKGCAHGFQTLVPDTVVMYFVSQYYTPEAEGGIRWDDPQFQIKWPVSDVHLSPKDSNWPDYSNK